MLANTNMSADIFW